MPTADLIFNILCKPFFMLQSCSMIDIHEQIDENEESTLQERERPYWPFIPSPCTVSVCKVYGVFSSFRDFREYWTKKHQVRDHIINAKVVINVSVITHMLNPINSPESTKDNLLLSNL